MLFRTTISLALALAPAPLLAQAFVQPLGITDADRLAEQVRRLGANPRDLDALLSAAELSVKLDDLSAAGSFLARADKVAPATARGLAIKAALLVRSERPGEALRTFSQAEAMGLATARFAAERGLAYDLIGEQRRAQTDYRLALAGDGNADEVRRRLALSLGIAGKQREALAELDPLVRRNDRAAWRARAFILAMGGATTEALGIAQTMMPPGSAQGLQGFFAELPRLPATDRAFAVHFGQVRATPQRLADARLAPQLAALPPEPVQVAAVRVAPPPAPARERGRRGKPKVGRVALPTPASAPVQVAAAETLPPPPSYRAPAYQPSIRAVAPVAAASDRPLTPGEQASLAAATSRPARDRARTAAPAAERAGLAVAARATPFVERPVTLAAARPVVREPAPTVATAPARLLQPSVSATPIASAPAIPASTTGATAPAIASGSPPASLPAPSALATSAPASVAPPLVASLAAPTPAVPVADTLAADAATSTAVPEPVPVLASSAAPAAVEVAADTVGTAAAASPPVEIASATPARAAAPLPVRPPRVSAAKADDILAKIVANLSIPASELGIDKPAPGARPARAAERLAAVKKPAATRTDEGGAIAAAPNDRRAADRRLAADKKAAAEKKALADKEAAEKRAERVQPARIWVQVAGGANEGDLDKAWRSVKAKAPAALAGKQGYTTPLRATNRVLTGPFKTEAEARAHVNQLAKSGVSAFSFKSDAGQKVSRLDAK